MKNNHCIIIFTLIITQISLSMDNAHFYRATNIFPEPRLEHDDFSTFNITLGQGSTSTSRSHNNSLVPLFDIYGQHSFNKTTMPLDSQNPFDHLFIELNKLPSRPHFATVSINGKFNILEANLSFTHNVQHGLFLFFHIPMRKLTISHVDFIDLSPDDSVFPNKNTPQWYTIFHNLNQYLANYHINSNPVTTVGVGDLSSWLGWTHNYQETKILDFIDFTCMTGFLAPTGKQKNENQLFSLPTGYNGHWGFPLCAATSIGFYEWITIGGYLNTLFFLNKNRIMRIKTNPEQSGIIKLVRADVSEHRGPLIHIGGYFKADHVGHGVSVTAAYSFVSQQKRSLSLYNPTSFDHTIINSDEMLKRWNMHTINFFAEYDFAQEGTSVGNRIGLFYNLQIAGSRVFNTNIFGGSYGIDISWYI